MSSGSGQFIACQVVESSKLVPGNEHYLTGREIQDDMPDDDFIAINVPRRCRASGHGDEELTIFDIEVIRTHVEPHERVVARVGVRDHVVENVQLDVAVVRLTEDPALKPAEVVPVEHVSARASHLAVDVEGKYELVAVAVGVSGGTGPGMIVAEASLIKLSIPSGRQVPSSP